MNWSNFITGLFLLPKLFNKCVSCFMLRRLMASWQLNIWKVKIWLSQQQKEFSKLNKNIFLLLKALYFRHTKETSKNVAETAFKACVRYFFFLFIFFFTKWQALNNFEVCFLFHLESSFHYQVIQFFVSRSFTFFFSVSYWLRRRWKINIKVYDVRNCLNKNLITHFVWYLEKEKKI